MSTSVLVVEPSRTIRTLLDIYCQRNGHQVTVFASYAEARYALSLPQFKTYSPSVIFLALHASHPESYRLLEDLRWRYAHRFPRIVVMIFQESATITEYARWHRTNISCYSSSRSAFRMRSRLLLLLPLYPPTR